MNLVELKQVRKQFGDAIVLNDVTYSFEKNKCYVIKGKSGIGKSTLLNIIAGYVDCEQGQVVKPEYVKIDYMFQDELLFSNLTVFENLCLKYYGTHLEKNWNKEEVAKELDEIIRQFEIQELLERKVEMLSGGEKQRVVLANMLISQADILMMDEPVTKLDEENRKRIISLIEAMCVNKTVVIVSHIDLEFCIPVIYLGIEGGCLYEIK